jgi:hypothetical protein
MASKVALPAGQSKVGIFISTSLENGDDVVDGKGRVVNRRKSSAAHLAVRAVLVPEADPLGSFRARAHAVDHFLKLARLRRKIFAFPHDLWQHSKRSIDNRQDRKVAHEMTHFLSHEVQLAAQQAASADRCISRSFHRTAIRWRHLA